MVVVLGGGLSGLSAAHYLLRRGVNNIQLFEAAARVGGWVRTERNVDQGFLFEQGPRTIRPVGITGANTLNLIDQLGLQEEVVAVPKTHVAAKKRLIYVQNQLHELPSSFGGLMRQQKPFSAPLITALYRDYKSPAPKSRLVDDSIYNFVERRFGREIADYAISAMICGICAGNAKEISVKFLMKNLYELEQEHGGVIRGILGSFMKSKVPPSKIERSLLAKKAMDEKWFVYTIRGGLQTLIEALEDNVRQGDVQLNLEERCKQISFANGKADMKFENNSSSTTDQLICTLPTYSLAPLVAPEHPKLSEMLTKIPYANVAVVNVQFKGKVLDREGFGLLVPPCEELSLLGIIFDSCCFDMGDNTVFTLMMGGHSFDKYFGGNSDESVFLDTAKTHLKTIMGITQAPDSYRVHILRNCIPQYTVGHYERIAEIREYVAQKKLPLELCGSAYDGIAVNDVIWSAANAVERVVQGTL